MKVKAKLLHSDAVLPVYETDGSAGFDLRAGKDNFIEPDHTKLISTGLIIASPPGCMLLIAPRSSTWDRKGLIMPHSVGIVDADYCGEEDEIKLQLTNPGNRTVEIHKGERLAQGIFVRIARYQFEECQNMGVSRGGYGSTGVF